MAKGRNEDLPLRDWVRLTDYDPLLVSISEPRKESKGFMKTSVLYGVRTTSQQGVRLVERSYKDFVAFRTVLFKRFPGACIPTLPPPTLKSSKTEQFVNKRMHLLEFFMLAVAQNPFFRSDDVWDKFVADNSSFDRSLANGDKAQTTANSEGFHRWKQALEEAKVNEPDQLAAAVTAELDLIRKTLKELRRAAQTQVDRLAALSSSSVDLYQAFADLYVLERDSIQFLSGSAQVPARPAAESQEPTAVTMSDVLVQLADDTSQYAAVLKSDNHYSAKKLEAILVDPIVFELGLAEMWKEHMDDINILINQRHRAETLHNGLKAELHHMKKKLKAEGDPKGRLAKTIKAYETRSLIEAENDLSRARALLTHKERGLFGIELLRYRASRTLRMEKLLQSFSRYHLRGLDEIAKVFEGSGAEVTLARNNRGGIIVVRNERVEDQDMDHERGSVSTMDSVASHHQNRAAKKNRVGLLSFARGGHYRKKKVSDPDAVLEHVIGGDFLEQSSQMQRFSVKGVTVKVTKDFTASRSDELDVHRGEILTGRSVDDGFWYLTNLKGLSGLVPGSILQVGSERSKADVPTVLSKHGVELPPAPASHKPSLPAAPPGLSAAGVAHAVATTARRLSRGRNSVERKDEDTADEASLSRSGANKELENTDSVEVSSNDDEEKEEEEEEEEEEEDDEEDDEDDNEEAERHREQLRRKELELEKEHLKRRERERQQELEEEEKEFRAEQQRQAQAKLLAAKQAKANAKSKGKSKRSNNLRKLRGSKDGRKEPLPGLPGKDMLNAIRGFSREKDLKHEDHPADWSPSQKKKVHFSPLSTTNPIEELRLKMAQMAQQKSQQNSSQNFDDDDIDVNDYKL